MRNFKTLNPYVALSTLMIFCAVIQVYGQLPPADPTIKKLPENQFSILIDTTKSKAKTQSVMSLIGPGNGGAQGTAESTLPPVVLPGPNSAVLTRLVSENVDLYTGKLNVDIPVYSLKGRTIEWPVSLQTNVNAHKVNEYAGSVGIGWHLNAGGMITRVMKNLPDEFTGVINSTHYNLQGYGYIKLKTLVDVDVSLFESGSYNLNKKKEIIDRGNWNVGQNLPSMGYDLQPDEFYFNFGKHSGKFIFDQDGKIHLLSKANMVITPTYEVLDGKNKINSFTVKTDDGYQYVFGTYAKNAVEETKLAISSKTMRYFYKARTTSTGALVQDAATLRYYYDREPVVFTVLDPPATITHDDFDNPNNQENKELFFYPSTWYLVSVSAPSSEQIVFNYTDNGVINYMADRNFSASIINLEEEGQFQGAQYFLSKVEPVKSVTWWAYHYPSPAIFTTSYSNVQLKSKRLASIVTEQGHTVLFSYNTPREDFPDDKRLDKITVKNSDNYILKEFLLNYEIRSSNEELEKFKFSFNGTQLFYNNTGNTYSGYNYGKYYAVPRTFDIPAYCRKRMFLSSMQETGNGIQLPPYKFSYNETPLPYISSTEQDRYGYANSNPSKFPFEGLQYRWVSNGFIKTVPSSISSMGILYFQTTNIWDSGTWPITTEHGSRNYDIEKMKAGVLNKITTPMGGEKRFEFELNGISTTWSGLRIKNIKEYTSASATPFVKEYTYGTYYATDGVSLKYESPEIIAASDYIDSRIFFSSSRVVPENLTRGAAGGYEYAEIKQPGNGRYRIEFTNPGMDGFKEVQNTAMAISDILVGTTQPWPGGMPFPANTSPDWKRGLPLFEYYYDEQNKLLRKIEYGYDYTSFNQPVKNIEGMTVSKVKLNFTLGGWNCFLYGKTTWNPSWLTQSSKTEVIYAADGVNKVESRTEFANRKVTIQGNEYMFPDQTKHIKPDRNEQVITKFKYPFDYTFTNLTTDTWQMGYSKLLSSGIYSTPAERYQYVQNPDGSNKRYIGGALNKYKSTNPFLIQTWAWQPASTLNTYTESSVSSGTFTYDPQFKPIANFTQLLSNGSVLEQNEEARSTESFIWDYNNTYPVAKVVNAAYNDIAYTSFEADGTGSFNINSSTRITTDALTGKKSYQLSGGTITRSGLTSAQTYIVSYWAKPGAAVTITGTISTLQGPQQKGWVYWEKKISGVTSTTISGSGLIDELRLYPRNARMTTYTFDPLTGMTGQCDANNRTVGYIYDGLQRLILVKDADNNVVKTYDYNYQLAGTNSMLVPTNERRCKPCELNENYTTRVQQIKHIDKNPNSPTYNQEIWFDNYDNGVCEAQPAWQNISGPVCLTNTNGQNTGIQRYVQKDMNPCSDTYNQTRDKDELNYAGCPSTIPNWQPTADYRCKPCAANTAYNSNVQERKYVDMNPSSSSYQQFSWQATGAICQVSPGWQFTATPPRCQVDQFGLNTGNEEKERKDMNPCSPTYNQLEWVVTGQASNCTPLYMVLSIENVTSTYDGVIADIYVKFYSDANHTIPVQANDMIIKFGTTSYDDCGGPWNSSSEDVLVFGEMSPLAVGVYLSRIDGNSCVTTFEYTIAP